MWVLGIKSGSSGRSFRAPRHCAISSAPNQMNFNAHISSYIHVINQRILKNMLPLLLTVQLLWIGWFYSSRRIKISVSTHRRSASRNASTELKTRKCSVALVSIIHLSKCITPERKDSSTMLCREVSPGRRLCNTLWKLKRTVNADLLYGVGVLWIGARLYLLAQ